MRAVTQEELQQIAGGLIKKAPLKLREMLMKPPGSGGGTPGTWNNPVTVTASAPGGGSGGYGWGGGSVYSPPSTGGGGGGSSSSANGGQGADAFFDGTHYIGDRNFTSKIAGRNNPGDLMYSSNAAYDQHYGMTGKVADNGTATFATEKQGRVALGEWLDNNAGNDSVSNFENSSHYNPNTAANPHEADTNTASVEQYMGYYGYTNFTASIHSMDSEEYNIFLDAVTRAEGVTNF